MVEELDLDAKEGFEYVCDNGNVMTVEPHSERVALHFWKGNGAMIEALVYSEPCKDRYGNDRIHLLVHPEGDEPNGFLMTITEARVIRKVLEVAIEDARDLGIPEE